MTAYTTISNALVAVGAKPFATTIQALRDNILAIQEGDATAPKIQDAALDTGAATAAGIAWVGLRMAAAPAGGVGTYAFLGKSGGTSQPASAFDATEAGSGLTPIGFSQGGGTTNFAVGGGARSGTWRCMGNVPAASGTSSINGSLWLRIA